MTPQPDLLEIAPSLYRLRIPGGPAHLLNSYIWVGEESVTLIDTGWADSAPLIESALHVLERQRADVSRVILTHFHDDHAGAAAEIAGWGDVQILAGAPEAAVIRGVSDGPIARLTSAERVIHPEPAVPPAGLPCRVDLEVADGDSIEFAGGARVLYTPGHTDGSIALHLSQLDVLLTGDTVAEFNGDVILGVFNVDRAATRRSANRIAATGASIAGFGHGDAVLSEASERIRDAQDPFEDPGA